MVPPPPRSTLFPYTTLFRSGVEVLLEGGLLDHQAGAHDVVGHGQGVGLAQVDLDARSEEHTSELQSQSNLVCRLLLEKKKSSARILCHGLHATLTHDWIEQ